MDREQSLKIVVDGLSWLVSKLEGRGVARLYDLHGISEHFIKDFLNELRGLSLENLNRGGQQHPAIDLGDTTRRLAFQVTTEKTSTKIQDSLKTFFDHSLELKYDQVFFLILGEKQKTYSIKTALNGFDPAKHIIDRNDLIREVSAADSHRLNRLAEIIQREGLLPNATSDTDQQAIQKIHLHFDRDALKHHWHQEGNIGKFADALEELTELLGTGCIKGVKITKPMHLFADEQDIHNLRRLKNALGELRAAFNERLNSDEIQPNGFACFRDRKTADVMNAAKQQVLHAVNCLGGRYNLPAIFMNPSRW